MRKADNLPPYCAVVKNSRSHNFLDLSGPAWPVTGVLYLYLSLVSNIVFLTTFQSLLMLIPRTFSVSFPAMSATFKSHTLNLLSVNNAVYLAAGSKVFNPLIRGFHSTVDEDKTPCRLLISYRRFGIVYCLKLHDSSTSLNP